MRATLRGLELLPVNGDWTGARVGVLGMGRSGRGAVRLLRRHGAVALAFEDRPTGALRAELAADGLADVELRVATDASATEEVHALDVLVVSPGVAPDHPLLMAADVAGVVVISELELAWRRTRGTVVAVTGTNGKSTTVSLIHEILRAAGRESVLAGNIGTALSDEVESVGEDGIVVVECSSFQLERIMDFRPRVAAVLNVAPDHLDRYADFEEYAAAKRNLLRNQQPGDLFVFPCGDRIVADWSAAATGEVAGFALARDPDAGAWVEGGHVMRRQGRRTEAVVAVDDLRLVGRHNLLNVTAAIACVSPFSIGADAIAGALRDFAGLPHRAVAVPSEDGRTWIDDSKATNVHAASATLAGLAGPVVLLVGGSGKGEDYSPLAGWADRIRRALCFGAEGGRIAGSLGGAVDCEVLATMLDAARRAAEVSEPGDTVLLSPACASFDEFSGFAERGEVFSRWVRENRGGKR